MAQWLITPTPRSQFRWLTMTEGDLTFWNSFQTSHPDRDIYTHIDENKITSIFFNILKFLLFRSFTCLVRVFLRFIYLRLLWFLSESDCLLYIRFLTFVCSFCILLLWWKYFSVVKLSQWHLQSLLYIKSYCPQIKILQNFAFLLLYYWSLSAVSLVYLRIQIYWISVIIRVDFLVLLLWF